MCVLFQFKIKATKTPTNFEPELDLPKLINSDSEPKFALPDLINSDTENKSATATDSETEFAVPDLINSDTENASDTATSSDFHSHTSKHKVQIETSASDSEDQKLVSRVTTDKFRATVKIG